MARAWALLAAAATFIAAFQLGSMTDVSDYDAREFMDGFEELIEGIDAVGIFAHNAPIAAFMFVPGAGAAWGVFSAWSTGYAFAAIATLEPAAAGIPAVAILATPFGAMELAAYSLAMSRSAILALAMVRRGGLRPHARATAAEAGIVFALLAAAAAVEHVMLGLAGTGPEHAAASRAA